MAVPLDGSLVKSGRCLSELSTCATQAGMTEAGDAGLESSESDSDWLIGGGADWPKEDKRWADQTDVQSVIRSGGARVSQTCCVSGKNRSLCSRVLLLGTQSHQMPNLDANSASSLHNCRRNIFISNREDWAWASSPFKK